MYFTKSVFFLFISVSACQCPAHFEDADFIEQFIAKEDPLQYIKDQIFSDTWVRDYYTEIVKCSYTFYVSQSDGSILQKAHYIHQTGIEVISGTELMKRTDKVGVFSLSGTHVTTQKEYSGKMYVFYTSKNVVAYYACEENGVNWNMAVQVRSGHKPYEREVGYTLEEIFNKIAEMEKWPGVKFSREDFKSYHTFHICP